MSSEGKPLLSIVIAATDSTPAFRRTVESLALTDDSIQILVAYDPVRIKPQTSPPNLQWIAGNAGDNAHRLRRLGMNGARANLIAFTEDSCVLGPRWANAWIDCFLDPSIDAATGPVEPRRGASSIDLAVFLCEYAPFLTENRPCRSGRLAGNNFAVRKTFTPEADESIHEHEVAASARFIAFSPSAIASHVRSYSLTEAIHDRIRFGFEYGRYSAKKASSFRKITRRVAGPGMLASQIARLVITLLRKRRLDFDLLLSFHITCALLAAWTVGEWLGWCSWFDSTSSRPRVKKSGPI